MSMNPKTASARKPTTAAAPRVLLVHGIWNAKLWLAPFAMRLRREGLAPELFGYDSVWRDPERAGDRLIAHLRRKPVELLVGHSLGAYWALKMSALCKIPTVIANPSLHPDFREGQR